MLGLLPVDQTQVAAIVALAEDINDVPLIAKHIHEKQLMQAKIIMLFFVGALVFSVIGYTSVFGHNINGWFLLGFAFGIMASPMLTGMFSLTFILPKLIKASEQEFLKQRGYPQQKKQIII